MPITGKGVFMNQQSNKLRCVQPHVNSSHLVARNSKCYVGFIVGVKSLAPSQNRSVWVGCGDRCAESTNYPREVAEQALAHALESKVEAAYRRSDLLVKRRKLMELWAQFCTSTQTDARVRPIRASK